MDLDVKIQANTQGFFVVTFLDPEKKLTKKNVKYIFRKFGTVSEIKCAPEHGRFFISYKEKEGALKALEIVNMITASLTLLNFIKFFKNLPLKIMSR